MDHVESVERERHRVRLVELVSGVSWLWAIVYAHNVEASLLIAASGAATTREQIKQEWSATSSLSRFLDGGEGYCVMVVPAIWPVSVNS